jgi:WD40 repeat protein
LPVYRCISRKGNSKVFRTSDWSVVAATPTVERSGGSPVHARFAPTGDCLSNKRRVVLDIPSRPERDFNQRISPGPNALSRNTQYFALGGEDNLIRIYDFKNSKALPPLAGHAAGVWGLAFSPDSRTLASAGDKRIKLWSVNTWQELFTLHHGDRNPSG